jgi:hypothetical protein
VVSVGNLNTYLFTPNVQFELFLGGVGWKEVIFSPLFLSLSKGGWEEVLRGWGGFFYAFEGVFFFGGMGK